MLLWIQRFGISIQCYSHYCNSDSSYDQITQLFTAFAQEFETLNGIITVYRLPAGRPPLSQSSPLSARQYLPPRAGSHSLTPRRLAYEESTYGGVKRDRGSSMLDDGSGQDDIVPGLRFSSCPGNLAVWDAELESAGEQLHVPELLPGCIYRMTQCFCFQNQIKKIVDTLIQKVFF